MLRRGFIASFLGLFGLGAMDSPKNGKEWVTPVGAIKFVKGVRIELGPWGERPQLVFEYGWLKCVGGKLYEIEGN